MQLSTLSRALGKSLMSAAAVPFVCAISLVSIPASAEQIAAGGMILEEIVASSRWRPESIQDTPVSVVVFQRGDVERLAPRTLRDFDGLAPNVFIGMNPSGPGAGAIFIRGVGYAGVEKTQSPAVAVILDGIVQATNTGQLIDAFDVEQIEINRGPQGVQFGKNTTGGTIVVERSKPTGEWGLREQFALGNYDERIVRLVGNAPIAKDTLALKVGVTSRQRDGFYTNSVTGSSSDRGEIAYLAATTSLLFTPNDTFEAQLTYDKIIDKSDIPPQDPRYNDDDPSDAPFVNEANLDEGANYTYDTWGLRMEWDLGGSRLYSITGYQAFDDLVVQDFDGTIGDARPVARYHSFRDQSYEQWSQEIRLTGDVTEKFRYNTGFFYLESQQTLFQDSRQIDVPFGETEYTTEYIANREVAHDVESLGVFAGFDWQFADQFEFSLGARYINEEKDFVMALEDSTSGASVLATPVAGRDSWDDLVLSTSLSWDATDCSTWYVSYAEGFRSGGFSMQALSLDTFDPEDVWTTEIGTKNHFFRGRVRANLTAFYSELKGKQFESFINNPNRAPRTSILVNNASMTEITGLEAEVAWLANQYFTFVASGGIQESDSDAFTIDGTRLPDAANGGAAGTSGAVRVDNEVVQRAPDFNWAVSMIYEREIGRGVVDGNVTYRGVGDFVITPRFHAGPLRQDGYELVDASVGYSWMMNSGARLRLSAFGKNIGDVNYLEQARTIGLRSDAQGWGAPRTAGISLEYEM